MKLDENVKSQIEKDAIKAIKKLKIDKTTNLHIHDEILAAGEKLKAASLVVSIERKTAFVFVDLAPTCNWAHPCEYHLYDATNGTLYKKVHASLPPSNILHDKKIMTSFHMPVKMIATQKRHASWKSISPITNTMSTAPGERYAILFAGLAQNRHTNDLEFLYRTLIDDYGYNPANIHVCNHDGTLNYFLNNATTSQITTTPIGTNLGNWPDNNEPYNTPYRMVVNHPGTRAGFQAALNAISNQIQPEDFLFIHTNNHGGGPCDGVNDYCMFEYDANVSWNPYYVNDFITDLGTLPQFEVLLVMMEQCRSGGFINPVINNSPAKWTHITTAVTENDYSLGGDLFDTFAEDWIAGIHGQYPNGNGLNQIVDTNSDGRISATEAFHYADAVHTYNGFVERFCPPPNGTPLRDGDTPTSSDSPSGYGAYIFLGFPAHDLFLRDNLEDHGREPLISGSISCSPDIIIFQNELLDPEAELCNPAVQQSDTLGEPVESGQDNFIYLRVQNRGTQPTGGTARVFWTDSSSFPTPLLWKEITDPVNPITIPDINPQEMKVVGPVVWKNQDIPHVAPGQIAHYCFIGLINSGNDPAPDPKTTIHTYDEYYNFICLCNNATWKNFDVTNIFKDSITNMSFAIQGWPKTTLSADLMIDLSQLPHDIQVTLRILKRLSSSASLENAQLIQESATHQKYQLVAGKQAFLRKTNLKASDKCQATLEILAPQQIADGNYRLSIAELIDGKEMGRVTRMLAVGQYPYMGNQRTHEVHVANCDWAAKISKRNKSAYQELEQALKHGYNGCLFCLPEYNKERI